jgi:hypothetical protein
MEEALNAGEAPNTNPNPNPNPAGDADKKSFGDYAGDMGTTIKTAGGKVMSVAGGVGLHSILTIFAVVIGIYVLDAIGLGLLAGGALACAIFLTMSYVGNGLQGGTWNPLDFLGSAFA